MIALRPPFALSEALAYQARERATALGERLLEELALADTADPNFERSPSRHLNGSPGFALTFLALAQHTGDGRFERAMHEQLQRAAQAPPTGIGPFDGVCTLRGVAALACAAEPRYRSFVGRCDEALATVRPPRAVPSWYAEYDVLSGWCAKRLAQSVEGPQAFDETSAYLTWLAGSETRWACGYEPDSPEGARRWLGMAHGIAGVLATLAISHASIAAPLRATMVGAARNLIGHARWDRGVASWPRAVEDVPDEPCRSVWCVGAAGIAIALLQVAQTVDDAYAEAIARDVLSTIARLPIVALKIDGQGFCHGTAGLSSIFFVAARRTGDLEYARACERFVIETLGALDRTEGRCFALGFDGVRYDALGAYNGISGIVLALLTAGGGFDERWMRLHALAP